MAAKLRSSLLCRPRALKLMWYSEKEKQPQYYLTFYWSFGSSWRSRATPPLSALSPCGVPAMVFWSGPVSLRKFPAGGLDGTAPPVVTSTPVRLTGAVEDTL